MGSQGRLRRTGKYKRGIRVQKKWQNTNDAGMRDTQEVRIRYAGVIMYKRD